MLTGAGGRRVAAHIKRHSDGPDLPELFLAFRRKHPSSFFGSDQSRQLLLSPTRSETLSGTRNASPLRRQLTALLDGTSPQRILQQRHPDASLGEAFPASHQVSTAGTNKVEISYKAVIWLALWSSDKTIDLQRCGSGFESYRNTSANSHKLSLNNSFSNCSKPSVN